MSQTLQEDTTLQLGCLLTAALVLCICKDPAGYRGVCGWQQEAAAST